MGFYISTRQILLSEYRILFLQYVGPPFVEITQFFIFVWFKVSRIGLDFDQLSKTYQIYQS